MALGWCLHMDRVPSFSPGHCPVTVHWAGGSRTPLLSPKHASVANGGRSYYGVATPPVQVLPPAQGYVRVTGI